MPTLEWIGKSKVVNHHLDVPYCVLNRKYSYDENGQHEEDNSSENMIIHGDNLLALKSLLPQYEGKIKCIYIDPPYNTGEDGWIYNDNVNDSRFKQWLGAVVGKEGEDLSRHDKWLCMMYPRLKLLHRLLSDDGAIFISIDENELYNLKLTCDEIFGSRNHIATFVWEKRLNRENRKEVSSRHDYIVCFAKNKHEKERTIKLLEMSGEALDRYKNPDNDPRGPWKSDPITAQAGHATKNQFYTLTIPNGRAFTPPAGSCWRYTKEKFEELLADNRIWLGVSGNNVPRKKTFLYEKDRGLTPETLWFATDVSTNESAKNELRYMFSDTVPFVTPKPHELVERIIQLTCDDDSIILDSFAGSGTTAHAVLNMNKQHGGNRKFILIEMMDYADTITAERVKRVIDGYGEGKKVVAGTSGNFSFYELGAPIFNGDVLNEDIGEDEIRKYVYFTETKQSLPPRKADEPYYMGTYMDVSYYFNYARDSITTLNRDILHTVKTKSEGYIMYADLCTLSTRELEKWHITFKKIPRDISRL